MKSKSWIGTLLVVLGLMLQGCGGGGGGSGGETTPPPINNNWNNMTWDQDHWG